jgi:Na+/H+ antiporter NhaA
MGVIAALQFLVSWSGDKVQAEFLCLTVRSSVGNRFWRFSLGIIAGLFIGKQLAVFGSLFLAIRPGFAAIPEAAMMAKLCTGFTMSLFIATLAFDDEIVLAQIRLGVLAASLLSGMVAALSPAASGRSK